MLRASEIAGLATCSSSGRARKRWASVCGKKVALGLDLLQRFGEELISAVEYLEREGVPTATSSPTTSASGPGGKPLTLTLFDFAGGVPPPILMQEPGLHGLSRASGMWDGYAERYSLRAA